MQAEGCKRVGAAEERRGQPGRTGWTGSLCTASCQGQPPPTWALSPLPRIPIWAPRSRLDPGFHMRWISSVHLANVACVCVCVPVCKHVGALGPRVCACVCVNVRTVRTKCQAVTLLSSYPLCPVTVVSPAPVSGLLQLTSSCWPAQNLRQGKACPVGPHPGEAAQDHRWPEASLGSSPCWPCWGGGRRRKQEMAGGLGKKVRLGNVSDGPALWEGIQLDPTCLPG